MTPSLRLCALLGLLVLGGCAGGPPPPAVQATGDRSLTLQHPWSGEAVRAVYRRGDAYDPQALRALAAVMRDRRTNEAGPLDPRLADLLWDLLARLGLREDLPVHVVSGYRSPHTNAALARTDRQVAENSYHVSGMAADIRIPGVPGRQVAEALRMMGRGGWAHYPRSDHVHLDVGPPRTWAVR